MYRPARIVSAALAVVLLSLQLADNSRAAEPKTLFDLPAESLDKALREFALQAHCNISYVPALVAGLRAPAIKGEYPRATVLSMLLAGTRLAAINVSDDMIQILEAPAANQRLGSPTPGLPADGTAEVHVVDSTTSNQTSSPKLDSAIKTTPVAAAPGGKEQRLDEIIVTGTHIRGVSSVSPVIEIGQPEIERSGYTSISDLMLSVPQNFGGGYNAGTVVANSYVNNRYSDNPTGASVPNLRGLGPGSTLTLIDGHRMASGLTGGGADIASIPLDAIDHIDVVTDSASSIYGSDAVAGVVNIILKQSFDGARSRVSYGMATEGGGTERRVSQLFGTTWASGNLVATYEYHQQDAVDARDREFSSATQGPFSLLPSSHSNALSFSMNQGLASETSAFADGLFVARDADYYITNPGIPTPFQSPSTLRKYAVTTGIDTKPGNWKVSVFVNSAEDATQSNTTFLGPSLISASDERQIGKMGAIEMDADGPLVTLPNGPLRLAVGAGYRQESFSDLLGTTGGPFTARTDGGRNIRYAFGELSLPLIQHSERVGLRYLDLVASARSERYSDFGEKTVPKIGLVYSPAESMKIRTTWGQAFRAPNLYDLASVQQLIVIDLPDTTSPAGVSPAFVKTGGNPGLQPETADSWSAGFDYAPADHPGLAVSTTIYQIKYTNRIQQLANPFAALTDPLNAFFVTRSPPSALTQSVYENYPSSEIFNTTGAPVDFASVAAIVDYRLVNVARQVATGSDLTVTYKMGSESNSVTLFTNLAYLDLTQQDTPESPTVELSGLAFYPAKFRARGGATLRWNELTFTTTMNYLGREMNTQLVPAQSVGSWTTADMSLRYDPPFSGALSGLHIGFSVINVLDRNPPRVLIPPTVQGINLDYDSSNASPMGRFVSLSIWKDW